MSSGLWGRAHPVPVQVIDTSFSLMDKVFLRDCDLFYSQSVMLPKNVALKLCHRVGAKSPPEEDSPTPKLAVNISVKHGPRPYL